MVVAFDVDLWSVVVCLDFSLRLTFSIFKGVELKKKNARKEI
jgi:hypothetical protein